jgi:drug/metabolite transporter (DMT)-like permease
MEAGRSSIIIIMELVTAVLSASILLNETMSPTEMVGGLLIVVAAFLEARRANGH